ncbi:MAG TPA: NAD(P)H-binding protein [Thermoanaerobaculia bacterium]|jgi:NAD(P)H dehydrogenase (quinone)
MNFHRKTLVVTGASGHLGRRVIELLLDAEAGRIVAATRSPEELAALADRGAEIRRADFDDPVSLIEAFAGADRLLLISTDALGRRLPQDRAAIDTALRTGVRHVVYTSLPNPDKWEGDFASEHAEAETALRASGLGWTMLRNNLYTDYLVTKLSNAIASGQLVAAAGDRGAAYVTREDCAGAAAAALASSDFDGRTFDVTGPAAVTHAELAKIASDISRSRVEYVRTPSGDSFDVAIAKGYLEAVTGSVEELTGYPPTSVAEFLTDHAEILIEAAEPPRAFGG